MTNKRKIVNDPVYGFLTIDDDIVFDIISHPWFQRHRQIKQLGFTYLVYPGAVHTRFSHMLGALGLMKRAIAVLRSKNVEISDEEALGVQLAILLHDIGHGAFSHTSEKAICNIHHEDLTLFFMQRLNKLFGGALDTAIEIFADSYPRHFLHQLVSSQLDVDRLDYLARDSFFTGVSEGIVGTERIINMLNVHEDTLVVDEKGIYSIEKFIISRRLMYWQVYLHKTVIAADNLFFNILKRARYLLSQGEQLPGVPQLLFLLSYRLEKKDFETDDSLLELFATIDDSDVMSTVKQWSHHSDKILSKLSSWLIYRNLPAIKVSPTPFSPDEKSIRIDEIVKSLEITEQEAEYFVSSGQLENHAYSFDDSEIKILFKSGECLGISQASDQLDRPFLEKSVKKYFLSFPKNIQMIKSVDIL